MSIGSVLLQPQRFQRSADADSAAALASDLFRISIRLASHPAQGASILEALTQTIEGISERVQQHVSDGFAAAQQRLRGWVQPMIDFVNSLSGMPLPGNVAGGAELGSQMMSQLAQQLQNLSLDRLRQLLGELFDILENDLEMTGQFVETQIWAFVDDFINRLNQLPPDADVQTTETWRELASLLDRMKRQFMDVLEFPRLEVEPLARLLLDLLRRSGVTEVVDKAACVSNRAGDAGSVVADLTRLVPFGASGGGSVGAANGNSSGNKQYAWYATWLLQYKFRELPLLGLSDLKQPAGLLNRFKSPPDGDQMTAELLSRFTDATKQLINAYDGSGPPSESLRLAVLAELNRLLQDRPVPDPDFWIELASEKLREAVNEFEEDKELILFHRRILEDSYPDELKRLPRDCCEDCGACCLKTCTFLGEFILEQIGWPGELVWIDEQRKYVMLGDKPMFAGENVSWEQAPIFDLQGLPIGKKYYIFQHFQPSTVECFARHMAWIADAARTPWHLALMQPGHRLVSIFNGLWDFGHGLHSLIANKPYSGHDPTSDWFKLLEWASPLALTFGSSFQNGTHPQATCCNSFLYWLTVWLGDTINMSSPNSTTNLVRDAVLTFMTLLNFGGPRDAPSTIPPHSAVNHEEIAGIVGISDLLFTLLLVSQVDRADYVNPTRVPGNVVALWLAGGFGMGLLAGFVGTVVAEIIAWAEDWKLLGVTMLKSWAKAWLLFWPLLYSVREGDTDEGRFNPLAAAFDGYPSSDNPSPYRLPYAAGQSYYVGQANAGMFSHNRIFNPAPNQTYAFDFSMDEGDEILAARAGTVVNFFENTPNNTVAGGAWNFIVIRHDVDDAGNPITPDPNHDLDVGGRQVITFAVYGHGQQNGVTNAFARWTPPVPTGGIIGTTVRQGQPIMLCDDTGTSFHNHLHMHVLPEMLPRPAGGPVQNNAYTIPFIFRDVDGDGVCKNLQWYESSNNRNT